MHHGGGARHVQRGSKKPLTVFLKGDTKLRRRRKLQIDFTTDTPNPTFVPTIEPTISPAPSVSPIPTIGPTSPTSNGAPSRVRESSSTGVVHIPIISKSTKDSSAPHAESQPLLKFAAVPVGFDILLETDSQQDLQEMAQEAKQILEDHLTFAFRQGFADQEGVAMRSVDLNVKSFLTPSTRRVLQHIQRFLQLSRAITLETRGVAGFQVNRNAVNTDQFLAKVNSIIDESVEAEELSSIFQNSTYGLSEFRVASVTNTRQSSDEKKDKPSIVEMVIAFCLIALMLASLIAYAYIFYRKRQKRLKRRKQFGVSGHKTPSPYKGVPRPRPHGASITPAATTVGQMTLSPSPQGVVPANSSESSYKGLGSESEEGDADIFAKELRMAASLDRRAWDDFQHRVGSTEEAKRRVHSPVYNSQNDVYRELDQGIEMGYRMSEESQAPSPPGAVGLTVTGDTVSIRSNKSFPYGDEDASPEYNPAIQFGTGEVNDYMAPVAGGEKMFEDEEVEQDDKNGGWSMAKKALSALNVSPTKSSQSNRSSSPRQATQSSSSPRAFSFLYNATESKMEPQAHHSTEYPVRAEQAKRLPSLNGDTSGSANAVRASPMSLSWSTNPIAGSSAGNGTTSAVRGSPRVSPNSSFSTSRVPSSRDGSFSASPAFGSTMAINEDMASALGSEADASDMLKEVQRLSQFVKSYERKKEHRLLREQAGDDIDLSNSLTASLDYDSLMDQVTSLQNVVDHGNPNELTRKFTSSTQGLTPTPTMSNSPTQSLTRHIDRVDSLQSDDSSDIFTMESDDLSRRLGITPFSVQKPLAYQNPPPQLHSISHISAAYYQRTASPEEQKRNGGRATGFREVTPRSGNKQSSSHGALRSLRNAGGAILDGPTAEAPSDEFTAGNGTRPGNMDRPFTPTKMRDPSTITARKRSLSGNKGFDGIVDMFESKEREPLYPPNESWQYNY